MYLVNDIDSLYNFIAYVVLRAPDKFPFEDYLPPNKQMTLDKAFAELRHGIDLIDVRVADESKKFKLNDILDQALLAYKAGERVRGAHLVQEFQDLIFRRDD